MTQGFVDHDLAVLRQSFQLLIGLTYLLALLRRQALHEAHSLKDAILLRPSQAVEISQPLFHFCLALGWQSLKLRLILEQLLLLVERPVSILAEPVSQLAARPRAFVQVRTVGILLAV